MKIHTAEIFLFFLSFFVVRKKKEKFEKIKLTRAVISNQIKYLYVLREKRECFY